MADFSTNDLQFLSGSQAKKKTDEERAREIRSRLAQKAALSRSNPLVQKINKKRSSKPLVYRAGKAPSNQTTMVAQNTNKPRKPSRFRSNQTEKSPIEVPDQTNIVKPSYEEAMVLSSSSDDGDGSSSDEEVEETTATAAAAQIPVIPHQTAHIISATNNDSSSSDDDDGDEEYQRRQQMKRNMLNAKQLQAPASLPPLPLPPPPPPPPPVQQLPTIPTPISSTASITAVSALISGTHQHVAINRRQAPSSSSSGSSGSSCSDSDSDDSGSDDQFRSSKPMFVPRAQRNQIKEAAASSSTSTFKLSAKQRQKNRENENKKNRIAETQKFLALKSSAGPNTDLLTQEIPNDDDGVHPEEELSAWKRREMLRIHETETANNAMFTDRSRRNMTDAQVSAEHARNGRNVQEEVRKQRAETMKRKTQEKSKSKSQKSSDHSHKRNISGLHKGAFA